MNNYYQQFNIRPPRNARLQANAPHSNLSNMNFHGPAVTVASARLLSLALPYANEHMYNALYSNRPAMAVARTPDFSAVGQAAFTPICMMNSHPGMIVMPAVPFDFANQPSTVCHPANFPDAADLLGQCVTKNAALLRNHIPALQPQAVSAGQTHNVHTLPRVSVTQSKVENTANLLSSDVHIPFRQVQWIPPNVQETGVPQIPYAVEIKPEVDETPQNRVPFGNFATVGSAVPVNSASYETGDSNQSVPAVCLDIAICSSSHCIDANTRTVGVLSVVGGVTDLTVTNAVEIKPQIDKSPQNQVQFGNFAMTGTAVPVYSANYETEHDNDRSVTATCLDIATDSSPHRLDANTSTVDVPSVVDGVTELTELTVTNAIEKTGRQKRSHCESYSGIKISKLHDEKVIKPCSVSLVRLARTNVTHCWCPRSSDSIHEFYVADDQQQNEPGADARPVPVQEKAKELLISQDISLSPSTHSVESDLSDLIRSDEDVGDGDAPHDGSTCLVNEDASPEKNECYEVMPTNSDALLLDMECDDETDGETLRVILPTKNFKTTSAETASSLPETPKSKQKHKVQTASHFSANPVDLDDDDFDVATVLEPGHRKASQRLAARACKDKICALFDMERIGEKEDGMLQVMLTKNFKTAGAKTASSLPEAAESKQLHKLPTTSHSNAFPINRDVDDFNVTVVEPECRTTNTTATMVHDHLPARAYKDMICAPESHLQTIEIKKSENSLLDVPLDSVSFHFEKQFKLLLLKPIFIPRNVLALLANLVSSATATTDHKQCSHISATDVTFNRIHCGGSCKHLFLCLLCPYIELSAEHVVQHVKQQHAKYASSINTSSEMLLHIYCRHCNFITYDSAALLIHFAIYHKVAEILLSTPKVIQSGPTCEPVVNAEANARKFPFYCCPDCGYIDVEWNRIIQHVLKEQSSESVFFNCVVRLIKVGYGGSAYCGSLTYVRLAREENHAQIRKEIYACVSCRYFSFYPAYALRHYIVHHSCLKVLYMCAASPCCPKRCTTSDDIISHIKGVHVTMKSMQFRCTATLLDSSTWTQLDISRGEMIAADVPVDVHHLSASAADNISLEADVEIVK